MKIKLKKIKLLFLDKSKLNLLIIFLAIVIYLFLFFIPEVKTLFVKITSASQVKSDIINTEKDWSNIDSFREKILRLGQKIGSYEKKLPSEKEIPAVLEYLSSAAKRLDVRITEIKPVQQTGEHQQIYYSTPILLKAECGYHALGRFLSELEKAARFMKISDIKITAHPYRNHIHDIQLMIVTYVMSQE